MAETRARTHLVVSTGNVSSDDGRPVPLGPDYLNVGAMLGLLTRGSYALEVKDTPTGKVVVACPVDDRGGVGTGPIYEYGPFLNWWRRRGFSIAC
jgi:hypothetical protein